MKAKWCQADRWTLAGVTLLVIAAGAAGAEQARLDALLISEAQALRSDYALPGMTVAVAGPTGVTAIAVGLADGQTGRAMDAATTMLAASIGKTFVAATVLRLCEAGRVTLDDPISRWLGDRDWFARLPNGAATAGVSTGSNDPSSRYGLGIAIRSQTDFGPVCGHRGWIPGYVSSLQYYSDYDLAVAFMVNTDVGIIDTEQPVIMAMEERLMRLLAED